MAIATSLKARALNQNEEILKNLYIRAEDRKGKEIFFWPFYPGEVKAGDALDLVSSQIIPALDPGCRLYLGYEIRFLRLPLLKMPESYFRQEKQLAIAGDDWHCQEPVEFVFVYQIASGDRGEDYGQKILLWNHDKEWRLRATIYGGELRWGNDEVLNPWMEISDFQGLARQRIILFSGRLGSTEGATKAPAKIEKNLGVLPYPFQLFLGYDFYKDFDLTEKAGGPSRRQVELPRAWPQLTP